MERKYIFLIVGIVVAVIVIGGIAGGLAYAAGQEKMKQRTTLILLSFTPVEFTIQVDASGAENWMGVWAITGDGGNSEISSGDTSHIGSGTGAMASYILTSAGTLTLRILINGAVVAQDTAVGVSDSATVSAVSPYQILLWLGLLI